MSTNTTLSEQSLPHDVVHMLNRYFTAAAEPVLNNNGFIDKYIGDGILAAFGTRGCVVASLELILRPACIVVNVGMPCGDVSRYARIAARSGFAPMIFMTRVRLGEFDRLARLALMATLLPVDLDGITCFDLS